MQHKIPRDANDYTPEMAQKRRDFVSRCSGAQFDHVGQFSLDPENLRGNIEHFSGVAQIPLGLAGPMLVHGEHAQGEFYVPLATTEGTLVGSYNRGMKLLREAGGGTVSVIEAGMQRAPVFGFESARQARSFGAWVRDHFEDIKAVADETSSVGRLLTIDQFQASRFRFLRFNYDTGDAAGQNMVGKATAAACQYINRQYEGIADFSLSGNFCTDKKHSSLNTLHTRGRRVVAEATIPASLIKEQMRTTPEALLRHRQQSAVGGFMAGVNNNGLHSANALAALFIATGQDVANLAESSSAIVHVEITGTGDYYFSITIPSLIVATYGGGTGLATQKECLELLGCYGKGRVNKLAEIIGATILCGELSLSAAVVTGDWIVSHEKYGRNR